MSAQLVHHPSHDELVDLVADAALVGVLRNKPRDEEIPAAVWWLMAECLRTSVTIRRSMNGVPTPGEDSATLVAEARLLNDAALAELAETTGARPRPITANTLPHDLSHPAATRPVFDLQLSILLVARMLVSHEVTAPQRLANTLAAHARALALLSDGSPRHPTAA
jgi:hypothetical protein